MTERHRHDRAWYGPRQVRSTTRLCAATTLVVHTWMRRPCSRGFSRATNTGVMTSRGLSALVFIWHRCALALLGSRRTCRSRQREHLRLVLPSPGLHVRCVYGAQCHRRPCWSSHRATRTLPCLSQHAAGLRLLMAAERRSRVATQVCNSGHRQHGHGHGELGRNILPANQAAAARSH